MGTMAKIHPLWTIPVACAACEGKGVTGTVDPKSEVEVCKECSGTGINKDPNAKPTDQKVADAAEQTVPAEVQHLQAPAQGVDQNSTSKSLEGELATSRDPRRADCTRDHS